VRHLAGNMYLCGDDRIAVLSADGDMLGCSPLCGAAALCLGRENLYCAAEDGAIWRLDSQTLMPLGICCGGPGICAMCLSDDGSRLYALLGEADCVLMADARSGQMLAVNRCGCNPQSLALFSGILYAAGGESGSIHLYDALTLEGRGGISLPGPVYSALLSTEGFYALCLTAQLSTLLIAGRGTQQHSIRLDGMPGSICIRDQHLYACTQGRLYVFDQKNIAPLGVRKAPGRANRLRICGGEMTACDPLSECVYRCRGGGPWIRICTGAKDMAVQERLPAG